jgi:hypothetical protein
MSRKPRLPHRRQSFDGELMEYGTPLRRAKKHRKTRSDRASLPLRPIPPSPADALCWQTTPAETAEMSADRGFCAFPTRPAPYGPSMIHWLSCRPSRKPTQLMTQTDMVKIMALSPLLPPSRWRADLPDRLHAAVQQKPYQSSASGERSLVLVKNYPLRLE